MIQSFIKYFSRFETKTFVFRGRIFRIRFSLLSICRLPSNFVETFFGIISTICIAFAVALCYHISVQCAAYDSIHKFIRHMGRILLCLFNIRPLVSINLKCVRRFAVDNSTLFTYNLMCVCQSGVKGMNYKKKIEELLEASKDGTITAAQVTEAGLHRSVLRESVNSGEIYRFGRGLYVRSSAWEDDFYLLQRRYGRGIYSHDTALYLLGYSDRTPAKYTMTFPKGYNAPSLKMENLIVKRVVPENYEFGRIEIESPSGNPIRVYDLERTLCDILRGNGSDIQIVNEAMKRYAASKDKNIHKLMQYADQLRVKPKVLRYMEVLL